MFYTKILMQLLLLNTESHDKVRCISDLYTQILENIYYKGHHKKVYKTNCMELIKNII